MLTQSSYTDNEKQSIRADIRKNNLSDDQVQQIYFAPKDYTEAMRKLTFNGDETGASLLKEISGLSVQFQEIPKAKILQNYIVKL
jgi:hypothetical protein